MWLFGISGLLLQIQEELQIKMNFQGLWRLGTENIFMKSPFFSILHPLITFSMLRNSKGWERSNVFNWALTFSVFYLFYFSYSETGLFLRQLLQVLSLFLNPKPLLLEGKFLIYVCLELLNCNILTIYVEQTVWTFWFFFKQSFVSLCNINICFSFVLKALMVYIDTFRFYLIIYHQICTSLIVKQGAIIITLGQQE